MHPQHGPPSVIFPRTSEIKALQEHVKDPEIKVLNVFGPPFIGKKWIADHLLLHSKLSYAWIHEKTTLELTSRHYDVIVLVISHGGRRSKDRIQEVMDKFVYNKLIIISHLNLSQLNDFEHLCIHHAMEVQGVEFNEMVNTLQSFGWLGSLNCEAWYCIYEQTQGYPWILAQIQHEVTRPRGLHEYVNLSGIHQHKYSPLIWQVVMRAPRARVIDPHSVDHMTPEFTHIIQALVVTHMWLPFEVEEYYPGFSFDLIRHKLAISTKHGGKCFFSPFFVFEMLRHTTTHVTSGVSVIDIGAFSRHVLRTTKMAADGFHTYQIEEMMMKNSEIYMTWFNFLAQPDDNQHLLLKCLPETINALVASMRFFDILINDKRLVNRAYQRVCEVALEAHLNSVEIPELSRKLATIESACANIQNLTTLDPSTALVRHRKALDRMLRTYGIGQHFERSGSYCDLLRYMVEPGELLVEYNAVEPSRKITRDILKVVCRSLFSFWTNESAAHLKEDMVEFLRQLYDRGILDKLFGADPDVLYQFKSAMLFMLADAPAEYQQLCGQLKRDVDLITEHHFMGARTHFGSTMFGAMENNYCILHERIGDRQKIYGCSKKSAQFKRVTRKSRANSYCISQLKYIYSGMVLGYFDQGETLRLIGELQEFIDSLLVEQKLQGVNDLLQELRNFYVFHFHRNIPWTLDDLVARIQLDFPPGVRTAGMVYLLGRIYQTTGREDAAREMAHKVRELMESTKGRVYHPMITLVDLRNFVHETLGGGGGGDGDI